MKTSLLVATASLLGVTTLGLLVPEARADRRSFTRTYEYLTMPEGETELELYTEQSRRRLGEPSPQALGLQLEIEHGITERWEVSLYQSFDQHAGPAPEDDQPLRFAELTLGTRYRVSERGELPVDLAGYAELGKVFGDSVYRSEVRAILARDFDRLGAALNLIGGVTFGAGVDETALEAGWAAGLAYEVVPEIKLGVESWGGLDVAHTDELAAAVGPAVAWAPSTSLWVAATAGFGLTEHTDDFSVRAVIGLRLQ